MHFHLISLPLPLLLLLLTTIATASPLLTKRDGAAVVAAVTTIANQLTVLNSTVTNYTGGLKGTFTAVKIQQQSLELNNDLETAIVTTQKSANFTDVESNHVAGAFLHLQPKIFSTLDNIVAKKPAFDTGFLGVASLAFLVKYNLETQRGLAAQLGDAVEAKLTPVYASLAPLINEQIVMKFESAIQAYD